MWFFLIFVAGVMFFSSISWGIHLFYSPNYKKTVLEFLAIRGASGHYEQLDDFVSFLGADGILILTLIGRKVDWLTAATLADDMHKIFCSAKDEIVADAISSTTRTEPNGDVSSP
jgi:hypothetical protein